MRDDNHNMLFKYDMQDEQKQKTALVIFQIS